MIAVGIPEQFFRVSQRGVATKRCLAGSMGSSLSSTAEDKEGEVYGSGENIFKDDIVPGR